MQTPGPVSLGLLEPARLYRGMRQIGGCAFPEACGRDGEGFASLVGNCGLPETFRRAASIPPSLGRRIALYAVVFTPYEWRQSLSGAGSFPEDECC